MLATFRAANFEFDFRFNTLRIFEFPSNWLGIFINFSYIKMTEINWNKPRNDKVGYPVSKTTAKCYQLRQSRLLLLMKK